MSLTVNVQLVLDDAALAAIAAGLPVTATPPPIVIPAPPPVTPPILDPIKHFGYFGGPTTAENADHTTFTFAPGWDVEEGLPLTRPTVLFAAWGQPMDAMLAKIKEQGGLHHIIALYPQDEPAEAGLNEEQTVAKFEAARAVARAVGLDPPPPVMVCYGRKGTPGFSNADIVGMDDYGRGAIKLDLVRGDQRRFYILGGCNPWREHPFPFVDAALADPKAWGVISFIWLDAWGGTQHLGVKSNGRAALHREAYARIGGKLPPVVVEPPAEPFDAAYYLEANPDVKAAIPQYFASAWDHYDRCGRAEGRQAVRPVVVVPVPPPVVPVPPPVPPAPAGWEPRAAYSSLAALKADLKGKAFEQAVNLGSDEVQSGFGPAFNYYLWEDGSVRRTEPPAAPRRPGDPLLASYQNLTALLEDAAAVGWDFALKVDGVIVKKGFEPDNPADMVYVTRAGKLVRP
jgi:hypothetical protein